MTPKPGRGLRGLLHDRFGSFLAVLGISALLLTELLVTAALAAFGQILPALAHSARLPALAGRYVRRVLSFGGIVYCIPDYVREVLKLLASEKKVLDYRLIRQSFQTDNKAVLIEFSGILKDHGYLAYDIKDDYFSAWKFLFQLAFPPCASRGSTPSR